METQTHAGSDDGMSFAEMFEQSLQQQDAVKEGEIVKGRVIEVGKDLVLIDIGYKSEASVRLDEFSLVEGQPAVQRGDQVDVYVESREDDSGLVIVSPTVAALFDQLDRYQPPPPSRQWIDRAST